LLAPLALEAQIATDRPSVTDSSAVVAAGFVQVENGFMDTAGQTDFPETLIRVGVGPTTEVRVTTPDYFAGPIAGFGDVSLGLKQALGTVAGFQVAAVFSLSFPTGAKALSSHGYDPSFNLPWSRSLSKNWTAAGMLSVYAPTENGSHRVYGESTFLLDRQLTAPWDAFVEYAGDFPQGGGPRHLLHFGPAYKITAKQQVDLHVGVGLSRAAVDHFVGVGYSFRFGLKK
jgi:hypothetical protein